jgi:hypothetical protein
MCQFQSLYYSNHGYVVRCGECACFQIAVGTTMLTLNEEDFGMLLSIVEYKCKEASGSSPLLRNIIIPTIASEVCLLLTSEEAHRFLYMLDQADSELRYNSLRGLFNS